jgi:hypothetical protein
LFTVVFDVSPAGAFGVPEEGQTVIPAQEGRYIGDTYHMAGVRDGLDW